MESRNRFVPVEMNEYDKDFTGIKFVIESEPRREATEAGGDIYKMKNALAFIYTCRGIPTVFQGTEQNKGNANGKLIDGIA
ncbi:MAG: hypothetical protein VZR06_07325, partial [Butyrivibrio sp.]|nr:hypothetical protein [Butyrivibrio sp.]